MSFIEVAMDDAIELGMAPEGRYDIVCTSAKVSDTKAGDRKKLSCVFAIEGSEEEYEAIFETFVFPNKKDWDENEGSTAKLFVLQLKRAMSVLSIAWDAKGFDPDQFAGAQAENVQLKCETGVDSIDRNKVVWPRGDVGM